MTRLLAVVLIAAGLTLVSAPARADVSITIHAGRTSLPAGESTAIRGKTVGAKPGSVVKLQRMVSGSWRTLKKKRVWSTRHYSFRVSPPRGYQRFRVKKAWHRGQPPAVSPTLKLAVLQVSIRAERTTLMHGDSTHIKGEAFGADRGSVVKLQHRVGGTWKTLRRKQVSSTRRYSFGLTPPRGYQRYRVMKPWQDGQPRVLSPVRKLTVQWRPTLTLSSVNHLVDHTDGSVTTTTNGNSSRLPEGSELRRQERQPDGAWSAGTPVAVTGGGNWSDTFSSRDGQELRYRSETLGARLSATSEEFVVDGSWHPTITASAQLDPLKDTAHVTGTSTGLAAGTPVRREMLYGDTWWERGDPVWVSADGSFTDSFAANMQRTYRYVVSEDGARKAAESPPFQVRDARPAQVTLNSTTEVTFPAAGTVRVLRLFLEAGQTFTYYTYESVATTAITDPSGAAVPGLGSVRGSVTAVASDTGEYAIRLELEDAEPPSSRRIYVTFSTPISIQTSLDASGRDLASKLHGQVVDMEFAAEAGEVISEHGIPAASDTGGDAALLGPSGAVIRPLAQIWGIGSAWRLPESGRYTMRITPFWNSRVDRDQQVVLTARTDSMTVDGAPGHVDFDRPGRLGVLTITVPAGLDLTLSVADHDYWAHRPHLFGPDGERIRLSYPSVDPTVEGTYTLLVASGGDEEADFYASTPATYDATVGSTVPFEQGPAPTREALIRIPVTAGELFSMGIYDDDGEFCGSVGVKRDNPLVEWAVAPYYQPSVIKIAQTGDLSVEATPCTTTGTFRSEPTTIASSVVAGTRDLGGGDFEITSMATFEATAPGQVMIVEYDSGQDWSNQVHLRTINSSFPAGTRMALNQGVAGTNNAEGFAGATAELLGTTYYRMTGKRYLYLWAGPTATGSLEVELKQLVY